MLRGKSSLQKQGLVGLGNAIAYFTTNDYVVSIPLNDGQKYDLIVDKNNSIEKVQVKTTRFSRVPGYWHVQLRTSGGNRSNKNRCSYLSSKSADQLFVLCDDGSRYLIPVKKVEGVGEITLGGEKYQSFKVG